MSAACGSSGSPSQAASSPTPAASPTVGEATITVAGTEEMILTTLSGMTLYYLASDVATAPKCGGACLTHCDFRTAYPSQRKRTSRGREGRGPLIAKALDVMRLLPGWVSGRHRRLGVWLGQRRTLDVVEGQCLSESRQVVGVGSPVAEGLPT